MVAVMARKAEADASSRRESDREVTTIKVYRSLAKTITQLAHLRDVNQQDLMDQYAKLLVDDLLVAMATRKKELRGNRQD